MKDVEAKLGFLKTQISPHVLFNTLSFIKYAVKHEPQMAQEAVDRLADLLSYGIYQDASLFTSLENEVEKINHIIALQEMRYDKKQNFLFKLDCPCAEIQIIPLVIIGIIENFFKHGNLMVKNYQAKIEITCSLGYLSLVTENKIARGFSQVESGNGLSLMRERLSLAYKGDYALEYGESEDVFKTFLKIPI